jgi:CRISPR/Cas system-associated protein Csx1
MKIPDCVKVAGHKIKINNVKTVDKGKSYGKSNGLGNKIKVANTLYGEKLAEEHVASTFLHEVLHQIDHKYVINLGEKKIRKLEIGLFQVLRDNNINFYKK